MVSPSLGEDSTSTNGALSNDKEAQLAAVASTDQPRRETTSTLPAERLAPAIQDFDAIISEDVQTYVTMSEEIGGLVAEQVWFSFRPTSYSHTDFSFCSPLL